MTVTELQAYLDKLDDGILRHGAHSPGREFCALEFKSQVDAEIAGVELSGRWTDNPSAVGMPDLRPLNDAGWSSDKVRTVALLPVMSRLWDYASWSSPRKGRWLEIVLLDTANELIATLPIFAENPALKLTTPLTTMVELRAWAARAEAAAWAARAAWAEAAAWAARAAWAEAAAWAARAAWAEAAEAESDRILNRACDIWIHAATITEGL